MAAAACSDEAGQPYRLVVGISAASGHLRRMLEVAELGAIILQRMPASYNRPATVQALVDHTVGRLLDLLHVGVPGALISRWSGTSHDWTREPQDGMRSSTEEAA